MTVFLALLTAHLLGDFLLQTAAQIKGKQRRERRAYLTHGLTHLLLTEALLLAFAPSVLVRWTSQLILFVLITFHLGADYLKEARFRVKPQRAWIFFLGDQAFHVLLLALAAGLLTTGGIAAHLREAGQTLVAHGDAILGVTSAYIAVIFGGGYLIRFVLAATGTMDPSPAAEAASHDVARETAAAAASRERLGMYIGWLERALVMTALLAGASGFVGFVIAAKAVIRFRETEPHFAEYFLLGTFLSLLIAGAGGLILRSWLLGTFGFVGG